MTLSAIVPSAGLSRRIGRGLEKPYRLLNQKPLLVYSLLALERMPWVDEIILVVARHRLTLAEPRSQLQLLVPKSYLPLLRFRQPAARPPQHRPRDPLRCLNSPPAPGTRRWW